MQECWEGEELCKACWPTGDELHNGHHGNRLSRWNPSSTPRVPRLLEHRASSVCVLVEGSYLKIDTSSVSGEN